MLRYIAIRAIKKRLVALFEDKIESKLFVVAARLALLKDEERGVESKVWGGIQCRIRMETEARKVNDDLLSV